MLPFATVISTKHKSTAEPEGMPLVLYLVMNQNIGQMRKGQGPKLLQLILWRPWMCVINFRFAEIFQLKTKCQAHGGTRGKVRESPKSAGFILWKP